MDENKIRISWISIFFFAIVNVIVFWGYFIDDAYISFRYLENVIAGNGLVFNTGERVESFSNFLWIVILIPFSLLEISPILSSRVIGAMFFFGVILLGKKIIDVIDPARRQNGNFSLPLLIASCPHLGFWATSGMETMAFSFFLCSCICLALQKSFSPTAKMLLPISSFCLTLCRPEGIALALLCYCFKVWQQRGRAGILGNAIFFGPSFSPR